MTHKQKTILAIGATTGLSVFAALVIALDTLFTEPLGADAAARLFMAGLAVLWFAPRSLRELRQRWEEARQEVTASRRAFGAAQPQWLGGLALAIFLFAVIVPMVVMKAML